MALSFRTPLQRLRKSLGPRTLAAALALLLAAVALQFWSGYLRQGTDRTGRETERITQHLKAASDAARQQQVSQVESVRTLPRRSEVADQVFKLAELAAEHRLTLTNTEYSLLPAAAAASAQAKIHFTGSATYGDTQSFLEAAQGDLPALRLQRISLERRKIADTALEVGLEFILFYRSGQP